MIRVTRRGSSSGTCRLRRCVFRCCPSTRHARRSLSRSRPRASLTCSTARRRFAGLRSFPMQPLEESPCRVPHQQGAASVERSPSQGPSAASPGRSEARRTSSSKGVGLLRHADLLDRLQDGLAPTHLHLDLSKLWDDLLSQFLLSAWHWLPPLVCSTPRFSLWKWCCLRGAGQLRHCGWAFTAILLNDDIHGRYGLANDMKPSYAPFA